jgi:putative membrane protein
MRSTLLSSLLPWEFSPLVLLVCVLALVFYLRGLAALSARGEIADGWRATAFLLGLALDYVVLQTHIDYLSQHMFWVHRLQHLILHHVGAALLVLASPGRALWQGLPASARGALKRLGGRTTLRKSLRFAFRTLQHPLVAPGLFVGLIYFWLIPSVHFGAMIDARRYRLMNWSMAIDGILFWWLMLTPRDSQGAAALGYPWRVLIVCLVALPQILLGAYIALHRSVLFDVYAVCGRAWSIDPLLDQELGGLLTWIPAAMMSGVAMLLILRLLLSEEAAKDGNGSRDISMSGTRT